jgi:hypothetical protein
MSAILEAFVTLLPTAAGGRDRPVEPREGSYRPHLRIPSDRDVVRARFIEGPPLLAPGDESLAILEVESPLPDGCVPGSELDLLEHERIVGIVTVMRLL